MLDTIISVIIEYITPFLTVGTLITVIGWIIAGVRQNKRTKQITPPAAVSEKTIAELKQHLAELKALHEKSETERKAEREEDKRTHEEESSFTTGLLYAISKVQDLAYSESALSGDTKANIKNVLTSAQSASQSFKDEVKNEMGELREAFKKLSLFVEEKATNIEQQADGKTKTKQVVIR